MMVKIMMTTDGDGGEEDDDDDDVVGGVDDRVTVTGMHLPLLLLVTALPTVLSLQCFHCGPYLSAPSRQCKGTPKAVDCTASKGCVFNHAEKEDGTFYVEKRCSYVEEDSQAEGQCTEVILE
ncbi:unnamed protein product [Enterobius vermicularis]|uniref:Secreted protein n=1 Tax=Enterobius vermicularis TaxID=51028 RepID=A0A0N4VII6_ENTVE|nr:unnamed protein product [Enterobius vermicularis]